MARPLIENHELPSAIRWELMRSEWHYRQGRPDLADECANAAHWLQQRLDHLLEGQLQ